jgi:signal transduction histidine kinase
MGGSGLGLAISRELIQAHGGDIVLVSTGESGTRFRITVPDRKEH